jgi:hypothetical protein
MRPRINLKQGASLAALVLAFGLVGSSARAATPAMPKEHHDQRGQDYTNNKNYEKGVREGRDDYSRNRDHFKPRKFKSEEDARAYEIGYQLGRYHKVVDQDDAARSADASRRDDATRRGDNK